MPSDASGFLSFTCPKCSKKLKAPDKLAGQKLSCPQCSSSIRVPGVVQKSADDDEWLSLDTKPEVKNESSKPASTTNSPRSQTTAKPARDAKAVGSNSPAEPNTKQKDRPRDEPQSVAPAALNPSPHSTKKASVFDDDLPDLIPLDDDSPSSDVLAPFERNAEVIEANVIDEFPSDSNLEIIEGDFSSVPIASVVSETQYDPPAAIPVKETKEAVRPTSSKSKGGNPKPSEIDTSLPAFGELDDDIPLVPLQPTAGKPKSRLVGSLEELMLEEEALVTTQAGKRDEEFSFKCRVCGTMLYARESQVGGRMVCPDCYSESSIPTPPPKVHRKIQGPTNTYDAPDVALAPIDSLSVRDDRSARAQSESILERAKEEVSREEKELEGIKGSFDSQRWIKLVFWFLQDPAVIIVTIMMSFVCSVWLGATSFVPVLFELEGQAGAILQAIVFLVPLIPLGGALLLVSLSVFSMVANQLKRVDDWPFNRIGDAFGDAFMCLAAVAVAAVPGGMIGTVMNALLSNYLGTISCSMISIWILFPFVFLSMANNNRITEPFSRVVYDSLRLRADAWGAMYLQTMLAFGCYFLAIALAILPGPVGEILCGLGLPTFAFFVMNQYGLLAGRLSDVTELGFEGDFSQDFVES